MITRYQDVRRRLSPIEVDANFDTLTADINVVKTGQDSGVIGYDTKAALLANLLSPDRSVALVTNDPTPANNGNYRKSGGAGTGSWVQSSFDRVVLLENKFPLFDNMLAEMVPSGGRNLLDGCSYTTDFYLAANIPVSNALWEYSDFIAVKPLTTYAKSNGATAGEGSFFDVNKNLITAIPSAGASTVPVEITTPAGCYFVKVNFIKATIHFFYEGTIASGMIYGKYILPWLDLPNIQFSDLGGCLAPAQLLDAVPNGGYDKFQGISWSMGYYLAGPDTLVANVNWKYSDYIPVIPSTHYVKEFGCLAGEGSFYDSDKVLIASIPSGGTFTDIVEFVTPADCYFVRLNELTAVNATFNQGTIAGGNVGMYSLPWLKVTTDQIANASTLTYAALGDSITEATPGYADTVNAALGFSSFAKLGISGSTAMPTVDRGELYTQIAGIPAGTDVITVLIGVNDSSFHNTIGDVAAVLAKPFASLDKSLSFAEAFRYCMETIKRSFETARIYVILPLQNVRIRPDNVPYNPLTEYLAAEIAIAHYLSIPVIDAHNESGIWANGTLFLDGLHPTTTGHALLGNYVARRMGSL